MATAAIYIALLAAMYLILVLPKQRETKRLNTMLAALEDGDEVYLNSGIHGFISSLEGQIAWIEIADGVDLKVSRSAIAGVISPEDLTADSDTQSGDTKDSD